MVTWSFANVTHLHERTDNDSTGEIDVSENFKPTDCDECNRRDEQGLEGPCAACRRAIHESWHQNGLWWIRSEECHPYLEIRRRKSNAGC
jgi:hypothetical protein